jgi:PAS domain S-box-containing protein/putative nucleotidyltransferase with HDIG domain
MALFKRSEGQNEPDGIPKEEVYRFLVERANDGIAIVQNSCFKFSNPRLREIIGYSSKELVERPFSSIVATTDLSNLVERQRRRQRGEDVQPSVEATLKHKEGRPVFVEINAGTISFEGAPAEIIVFRDITPRKKAEDELNLTMGKLRKAMGATIQALTLTVEMRDPYTAGHQRRVADLARSVAVKLGLSGEKADAIRMAAAIHDLGKISIPSEILSKPGRLSETEHTLVRTHPQVGYEILKQIDFPWPIARIVLEHHERLNGSGYPQHLGGDKIMLEARILSVADVVEAMMSHRPYRSAFQMSQALDEIKHNRGILYDPAAVDSCLRLFNEEGYEFK